MVFCVNCGHNIIEEQGKFCSKCGSQVVTKSKTITDHVSQKSSITPQNRSKWWYLLPIFLSIIGGMIAYFMLRNDDPKLAMNCFIVGIILSGIGIVFSLAI